MKYLPSVSVLAWSYTSKSFHQLLDTSEIREELWVCQKRWRSQRSKGTWDLPKSDSTLTLHLDLLNLFDRDGILSTDRVICSACANTHSKSLFSLEELDKLSGERRCLGTLGKFWICPHAALSQKQLSSPWHSRSYRSPEGLCERCPFIVVLGVFSARLCLAILKIPLE